MDNLHLYKSCIHGSLVDVKRFLTPKNMNERDPFDNTIFYYACKFGHLEIAMYLIQCNAETECFKTKETTLDWAYKHNMDPIIMILIQKVKNYMPFDELLHKYYMCLPAVKYLLSIGANVNSKDQGNLTIMDKVRSKKALGIFSFLIENYEISITKYVLYFACQNSSIKQIQIIIDTGIQFDIGYAINESIVAKNWKITRHLICKYDEFLKTGKMGDRFTQVILSEVIRCEQEEIAISMLKIGYPYLDSHFEIAVKKGKHLLVNEFLQLENIGGKKDMFFKIAFQNYDMETTKILLKNGYFPVVSKRIISQLIKTCGQKNRTQNAKFVELLLPYVDFPLKNTLDDLIRICCHLDTLKESVIDMADLLYINGAKIRIKKENAPVKLLKSKLSWKRKRILFLIRKKSTIPGIIKDSNDDIFRRICEFIR